MTEPYNFMTIDYRRPINERIWERFNYPVERPTLEMMEEPNRQTDTSSEEESESE